MLTSHFYPINYTPKKNTSWRKLNILETQVEKIQSNSLVKKNRSFETGNKSL